MNNLLRLILCIYFMRKPKNNRVPSSGGRVVTDKIFIIIIHESNKTV